MAEIIHKILVSAPASRVYGEFVRRRGPSSDSAAGPETDGLPARGALADFAIGDGKAVARMRLTELEDGARIAWQCFEGPADWIGTLVTFDIEANEKGDETVVRFRHQNWRAVTDFMGDCSTRWASFLFQVKSGLEVPEPEDLYI